MSKPESIVAALGGNENISEVHSCITRLRVTVKDVDGVSEDALKQAGAFGVVVHGHVVQVVVGPEADSLAGDIAKLR